MATGSIKKVSNDSASGYCKMPDGTLIQWGTNSATTATTSGNYPAFGGSMYRFYIQITFPIPFISTPAAFADGDNVLYGAVGVNFSNMTKTTIFIEGAHNSPGTTIAFCWLAIGRWK